MMLAGLGQIFVEAMNLQKPRQALAKDLALSSGAWRLPACLALKQHSQSRCLLAWVGSLLQRWPLEALSLPCLPDQTMQIQMNNWKF